MKKPPTFPFIKAALFLCLFVVSIPAFAQTTIISYGSTWKYLDNGTNQGTAWKASAFDASAWPSGAAELGYGDAPVTTVSYGPDANNKYTTTYFRISVNIPNPAAFTDFTLNIRRDDGAVVYINGTERYATNMPAGRLYNTFASGAAADDGATPQTTTLSSAFFSVGTNVIAVEVHQSDLTSSDVTFDLELIGNPATSTFINHSDTWKYLANGSNQGTTWKNVGFADGAWTTGTSEFGYGDGGEATCVASGGGGTLCTPTGTKYVTTYFRKTFTITGLAGYGGFSLDLIRDDGAVVYVNGVEVARDNMPGDAILYNTLAAAAISGTDETTAQTFFISPCAFVEGTNTIAVEMHQNDATSSDLSFSLRLTGTPTGGTPTLTRGPYLQMGAKTSITVRWRTSAPCYGRVEVGPSVGAYTTATVDETCQTTEHIVNITGLTADTKYYYRIGTTSATVLQGAADNFFTTLPPDNTTRKVRIVAFGDCGRGNTTYQDQNLANYQSYLTTNGIDAPDAWLLLGDNAYSAGTEAEYSTNFFGVYQGNILKNHKLYPAPGNHDYGNNTDNQDARTMPYHRNFTTPRSAELGGVASNRGNYYSYDIGSIHFLSLDSWGIEMDGTQMGSTTSAIKTWVTNDLAANTKKWVIAYWHHGGYTKGSHDSDGETELVNVRQQFAAFLESRGVDLIICGHSHVYERSYLLKGFTGAWNSYVAGTHAVSTNTATFTSGGTNCPYRYNSTPLNHGTVYVTAGSTGASTGAPFANFGAFAFPFSVNDGGVFYFEVQDNRLDAKMLRRNGSVFDQFTIMKDVAKTTNYTISEGQSQTLNASWPGVYSWSTGPATRSISVSPTAGTYNYSVTDNFGCITDNFALTVSPILPVTLLDYTVVLKDKKVITAWTTSAENNNKYFTVERSADAVHFEKVGIVNSNGNATTNQSYSLVDYNPLKGISYYRLSQTDLDGKTKYFEVKKINNQDGKGFEVKQLAAENGLLGLQINTLRAGMYKLCVHDMTGRKILCQDLQLQNGSTRHDVNLNRGMYVWEIRGNAEESVSQKVLIR